MKLWQWSQLLDLEKATPESLTLQPLNSKTQQCHLVAQRREKELCGTCEWFFSSSPFSHLTNSSLCNHSERSAPLEQLEVLRGKSFLFTPRSQCGSSNRWPSCNKTVFLTFDAPRFIHLSILIIFTFFKKKPWPCSVKDNFIFTIIGDITHR